MGAAGSGRGRTGGYTAAGPATFAYDDNGNLTNDGSTTYVYDAENRLVSASGATTAQLRYDPLGRLHEVSGSSAGTTRFLYDGDELVMEYDTAGVVLRRYVHGAGVDDPIIWYEGAALTDLRSLFANHQGSIAAVSDESGAALAINGYDAWGIPNSGNLGRFQYTGQIWLPELGMYHYKARLYSPTLGRFLQTDPIGYEDQINLYAYVGNDPVNGTDPTGTCTASADATKETAASDICQDAKDLNLSGDGAKNIIGFESVHTKAYKVGSDVATIGIGHTDGVKLGDTMTKEQIVGAFVADVGVAEGVVENLVGDLPVSQQEFDALVDLAFNVGQTKLNETNSPGLNQAIADGDYAAIGANLRYTRGPDGPSPGLVARSDSRQAIFNRGNYSQGVSRYNALLRRLRGN